MFACTAQVLYLQNYIAFSRIGRFDLAQYFFFSKIDPPSCLGLPYVSHGGFG